MRKRKRQQHPCPAYIGMKKGCAVSENTDRIEQTGCSAKKYRAEKDPVRKPRSTDHIHTEKGRKQAIWYFFHGFRLFHRFQFTFHIFILKYPSGNVNDECLGVDHRRVSDDLRRSTFLHSLFLSRFLTIFRQKDVMHVSSPVARRRLFHALFTNLLNKTKI